MVGKRNTRSPGGKPHSQHQNPSHNNNSSGDATMVDAPRGPTNNAAPRACHICGNLGHIAKDCAQRRPNNQGPSPSQNQQGPVKCTFCQKPGHIAEKCFRNPANARNQNGAAAHAGSAAVNTTPKSSSNNINNSSPAKGPLAMVGFTFANCVPTYTGAVPYCPNCNDTAHDHRHCSNQQAYQRLQYSVLTCWKCGFRGHTGDDCKHPAPQAQTHRCVVCHTVGHSAETCKNEAQKKLCAAVAYNGSRFVWHDKGEFKVDQHDVQVLGGQYQDQVNLLYENGVMLTPEREADVRRQVLSAQQIAFPTPTPHQHQIYSVQHSYTPHTTPPPAQSFVTPPYLASHPVNAVELMNLLAAITPRSSPSHTPRSAPPNTPFSTPGSEERRLQLINHCARSSQLYLKQNYTPLLITHRAEILETGHLSEATAWHVSGKIQQGCQFWRDPRAMEAMAEGQTPVCYACHSRGVFLDGEMMGIAADADLLGVRETSMWGVFVMFPCRCSGGGRYTFVREAL